MGDFPCTGLALEEGIISGLERCAYHAGRDKFCIKIPVI